MSLDHMIRRPSRWCAALALSISLSAGLPTARAQEPGPPLFGPDGQALPIQDSGNLTAQPYYAPPQSPEALFAATPSEDIGVGGMGVLGRFGHLAGQNIERDTSLTYLDLSPYMFVEDTYLFTDLRGFYTNEDEIGGSTGLGARHFFRNLNTIVGASFWYDMDASRNGVQFDQVGVSGEIFTEWLDIRANYYQPHGVTRRDISTQFVPGSERFVGNQLAFNTSTTTASAMEGGDLTFTIPIVGELAQQFNTELSAGGYHYQARTTDLEEVWGWKLRLDGDLFSKAVHSFLEFTNDNVFDSNVVFGIDLNYWNGLESRPRLGTSQFNRIAQWTRRNRNVVANTQDTLNPDQFAADPNGNVYRFLHVRNLVDGTGTPLAPPINSQAPFGGDGTIANPFRYLQEAFGDVGNILLASPPPSPVGFQDVYYVHADSVFDGANPQQQVENPLINSTIVLSNPSIILGESNFVTNTLPVQGGGTVTVPRATLGINRPDFRNINAGGGPVVQMANNSTFSGFSITNALASEAILVNGVGNVFARDNVINGVTGNGITVTNAFGIVNLDRTTISNTIGDGLLVNGGNANVSMQNGSIFHTAPGSFALRVLNNFNVVNLGGTSVTDINGLGVLIQGSASATTLGGPGADIFIDSGDPLAGLKVLDTTGNVAIGGDITIQNVGGFAVEIDNFDGIFNHSGDLTINNRNDIGVQLNNITGSVLFQGLTQINQGLGVAQGDAAINFQNSTGAVSFGSIDINGSFLGAGINIGDRLGLATNAGTASFAVLGGTEISNAGGVFAGTPSSSIQILNDGAAVTFGSGLGAANNSITGRTDVGIEIRNNTGAISFGGLTSVANGIQTESALQIFNNVGPVAFNGFSATNVLASQPPGAIPPILAAPVAGPGVDIRNNAAVSFGTLSASGASVAVTGGPLVYMSDNISVSTGGGALVNSAAVGVGAVHVDNTVPLAANIVFDSIRAIAAAGGTNAVLAQNMIGTFQVNGTGDAAANTIQGFTIAGSQFDNVTNIVLQNQVYTGNPGGAIDINTLTLAGTTDSLQVFNSTFTNNGVGAFGDAGGILALTVLDTNLQGNVFTANLGSSQIQLVSTTDDDYFVRMAGNNIIDGGIRNGLDMVSIDGLTTGGILHLNIVNNGNTATRAGGFQSQRAFFDGFGQAQAALGIDWQGSIAADSIVQNNVFNMQGQAHTGFRIVQSNAAVTNGILYAGNVLQTGTATTGANNFNGSVGLDWTFAGTTNARISSNGALPDANGVLTIPGFTMGGLSSTAMDVTFNGANSTVAIQGNLINFAGNAFFGTGVFVGQDVGNVNTVYNIGTNIINLIDANTSFPETGFDFSGVTAGTVILTNQGDNIVTSNFGPGAVDFLINAPPGTTTGQISINGNLVP